MPHVKFLVAGGLILGAISYLMFSGISDTMVYYYTVPEALAKAEQIQGMGIRVSGYVFPGSITRDPGRSRVQFLVCDDQRNQRIPVIYEGIIPDTFKDEAEVVVQGMYSSHEDLFRATILLAKCPSKYEATREKKEVEDTSTST
jgi:cytochrome c-type biogenesis protein CcmE